MKGPERQPGGRIGRRAALFSGIAAVVDLAIQVPSPAHAQGAPREITHPGIQPPLIGMLNGYPIYEQVPTSALIAQRDQQLRNVPLALDSNEKYERPNCAYTVWDSIPDVRSSFNERVYRQQREQAAAGRRAQGNQANAPGLPQHQRLVFWKNALLPLTTEQEFIRLELWTSDAAFNNNSTERHAFYLDDFRAYLRGQLALPPLPNSHNVIFRVRWVSGGEIVLEGNPTILPAMRESGPDLLTVIDMIDPEAAAQAAVLALKPPLSAAGRHICPPDTQNRQAP